MKKIIITAVICFLIGGVAGYFLRPVVNRGGGDRPDGMGRPGFERQRPDVMPSGMPDRPGFRPDAMPSGEPGMPESAGI